MVLVGAVRISSRTPGSIASLPNSRGMKICAMPEPMPMVSVSEGAPAQPPRRVGEAEHVADHALGLVQEGAALLGHLDAARGAAKQREADLLFEQLHLLADRGLRNVQPRGGLGEAALLGDGQRVANLAEFHSMFRGAAPLQRPPTMMENRSRANPPGPAELGIFHLTWAKPPNGERVISGGASSGNRPQWG